MKKLVIALVILLIIFVGCSTNPINDNNQSELDTTPVMTCEFEPVVPTDEDENEDIVYLSDPLFIEDYFAPIDVMVLPRNIIDVFFFQEYLVELEIISNFIRFYPFGEIMAQGIEGKASFVIFIENRFEVEQEVNLLRITPAGDTQLDNTPVFMEITQVPNTTVEEMEHKVSEAIDFSRYPINRHLQPTDNFPFVVIQLQDGGRLDSTVTSIYIRDNSHGGVIVVTTQHSFGERWIYGSDFMHALETLEIITEYDLLLLNNDDVTDNIYPNSSVTIQDLFDPRLAIIFIEGTPLLVRHNPFGKIVEADTDGMASFMIFIEDFYQVEQQDNLLRITPPWDMPPGFPEVFMEIKQVPNTTIAEMEYMIETTFDFDHFYSFREQYPVDFSIIKLGFYGDLDIMVNDVLIDIYIRDNGNGGVFVITMQYCHEAFTGHGVRFLNSIWTLTIIE